MAREIKDTPILSGKDAERFYYNLEHPSATPKEIMERGRSLYEMLKKQGFTL